METEEAEKERLLGKADGGPAAIPGGLDRFLIPVCSIEPARIAPGGTGTLVMALALREGAVLASASALELRYSEAQGPAHLAVWSIGDPSIGSDSAAFRGRPVYENYAIVRIPLSVDATAAHGKYPLSVQLVAELSDPKLGGSIGRYQGPANAQLLVGPALPMPPRPIGQAGRPAESGTAPGAVGAASVPQVPTSDADPRDPSIVTAPAIVPSSAGADEALTSGGADPLGADDGSQLLWLGAGVLGLGIAALLLGMRRRT